MIDKHHVEHEPALLQHAYGELLRVFRGQGKPLFAVMDTARDPGVLQLLPRSEEKYASLYEGGAADALASFAPYVVRLPSNSALLEALLREGWGKSWGVYLTSDKPMDEVRQHLRSLLWVKTEGEEELYFRFYDPRVLRVFLSKCTPDDAAEFFGPVSSYFVEGERQGDLFQFISTGGGVKQTRLTIGSGL